MFWCFFNNVIKITDFKNITLEMYNSNRFAVGQTVAVLTYVTTTQTKNEPPKKGTQRNNV